MRAIDPLVHSETQMSPLAKLSQKLTRADQGFVIALDRLAQANLEQQSAEDEVKQMLAGFSTQQLEDIYDICGELIRARIKV